VREVLTKFLRPNRALIRLDFPTLERPAKAISGGLDGAAIAGCLLR
jgi:hypothetical protein